MKITLADNIRNLRKAKGLTQEQFAEIMGVSLQSISRWETGVSEPNIQVIAEIADYFETSIDYLVGAKTDKESKELKNLFDDLQNGMSKKEQLLYLRELYKKYPRNPDIAYLICERTDDLEELRDMADIVLKIEGYDNKHRRISVIKSLISKEKEENVNSLLEKYGYSSDMGYNALLEQRYKTQGQWQEYVAMRQLSMVGYLTEDVFARMGTRPAPNPSIERCMWASKKIFKIINLLTDQENVDEIIGDGEIDLWAKTRILEGLRMSCYLASTGEKEKALTTLEKVTAYIEKLHNLPDGTELTYRCRGLDKLKAKVIRNAEEDVFDEYKLERGQKLLWIDFKGVNFMDWLCLNRYYDILIKNQGWEWFDPIRNEERYKACAERIRKCIVF